MIEMLGVPLLIKAVDFLFDEGHKILEERRERKRQEIEGQESVEVTQPAESLNHVPTDIATIDLETQKDKVLHQQVIESALATHEHEIEHLLALAKIQSRNYRLAKEQYAKWGSALVPPIIVNNLQEAEEAVADTTRKLQKALGAVSSKPILISGSEE